MSGRRWLAATVALAATLSTAAAWAHKASDAYLQLQVDERSATLRIDIALRDLDRDLVLDADDDGLLRWGEVRSRTADIDAMAERDIRLQVRDADGAACRPEAFMPLQLARHSDGRHAVLVRTWTCAKSPATAALSYALFAVTDPTHRGVLVWRPGGAAATAVLVPGTKDFPMAWSTVDGTASREGRRFDVFRGGVHHIWIGADHVLFLIALLLPAVLRRESGVWRPAEAWRPTLWQVCGVVTAFTVAHSITLGLAAFDVLQPPPRGVESVIALSVLLAALNNLHPVVVASRWRFTFLFGLVHGFGFASVLKDLGLARDELALPLLLFNLGVEAGQLVIVAAAIPLAWAARRWRGYPRWVLGAGSAVVAAIAVVWLVERVLDAA